MRRQFGKTIMTLAEKDNRIVLLTCDVLQKMDEFIKEWPDRFYNFGLTEQATVGIAAGMAIEGLRPIYYSLTPFVLERPFEQVKIDIDQQNLPVILIGNSDYPTAGSTHRDLNAKHMSKMFRNIDSYFPENSFQTEKAMLDSYLTGNPSLICLKNDRLPFI